jgi:hypothetical protein
LGGGIYNNLFSTVALANSMVSGNTAYFGGRIVNNGDLTLTNSTVSGNAVYGRGGAIYNGGDLILTNSTVSVNVAYWAGGGIHNGWSSYLALTNSTVSGNVGVGISLMRSNAYLTNSTVSGNYGSGIFIYYSSAYLTNSTVSGNYDGGIRNYGDGGAALTNTILASNNAPTCNGSVTSLGYNLADDTSCGLTATGDLVVADAMLGPLQDNGGPTETHDLLPGSPAIDAGSPGCPPPDTDQRGVARPQGAARDIEAVEAPEPARCLLLAAGLGCPVVLYWVRVRR